MNQETESYRAAIEAEIPAVTMHSLESYVNDRVETGGFLRAVLSNDLTRAVNRADLANARALPAIVRWLFNYAPQGCWGSPAAVASWLTGDDHDKKEER